MIWLTWRQARAQTVTALAAVAVLAAGLVLLGRSIRHSYDTTIVGCTPGEGCELARDAFIDRFSGPVGLAGGLLLGLPALVGLFWGAPLLTRELEDGTHQLIWNQSVTRTRWLAVKLGFGLIAGLVVAGVFSLALTWAVEPFDTVVGGRFTALTFSARDVVPLGYTVFGFVLGVTVGLLVRRTLPAMAITLAVFAVVQLLMPVAVRSHLMPAVNRTFTVTTETGQRIDGFGSERGEGDTAPVGLNGYTVPGAWMISSRVAELIKADGTPFTRAEMNQCSGGGGPDGLIRCMAGKNLHFTVKYQPAERYWPFQWIETALFGALALALAGLCRRQIPRVA